MKKKFLTLIALLLSASLVTACNEETSSADPANNNTITNGIVKLQNCKVNGSQTIYKYGNGRACTGTDTSCD